MSQAFIKAKSWKFKEDENLTSFSSSFLFLYNTCLTAVNMRTACEWVFKSRKRKSLLSWTKNIYFQRLLRPKRKIEKKEICRGKKLSNFLNLNFKTNDFYLPRTEIIIVNQEAKEAKRNNFSRNVPYKMQKKCFFF